MGSKVDMNGDIINLRVINRKRVPMEETDLDVLVELAVPAELSDPGLDIVAVLDVSPSKWGHHQKLEHLKDAIESLIRKLRPIDRMSVVTFSMNAHKLFSLCLMTPEAQAQVEMLVKHLVDVPGGSKSMTKALRMALHELNDSYSEGRMPVVFLISDITNGDTDTDAARIPPCSVPVHAIFFSRWSGFVGLRKEVMNSKEGTFLYLNNTGELDLYISRRLDDVVTPVKDIILTVRPVKVQIDDIEITSEITRVIDLGRHPGNIRSEVGRIVDIGNLSREEVHKVLVKLHLPAVDEEVAMEVIQVTYSCRYTGKSYDAPPMMVTITRTGQDVEQESDEVLRAQYTAEPQAPVLPVSITAAIGEATKSFNEVKPSLKTLNDIPQGSRMKTPPARVGTGSNPTGNYSPDTISDRP